jgi:hypothetical protein
VVADYSGEYARHAAPTIATAATMATKARIAIIQRSPKTAIAHARREGEQSVEDGGDSE